MEGNININFIYIRFGITIEFHIKTNVQVKSVLFKI